MFLLLLVFTFFNVGLYSQGLPFKSDYHSNIEEETKFVLQYLSNNENIALKNDLSPDAIYVLEYLHVYSPFGKELSGSETFLRKIFQLSNKIKESYIITALEIVYAVFPYEFMEEVSQLSSQSTNKRILSLAYLYLHRNSKVPKSLLKKLNKHKSDSLVHSTFQYDSILKDELSPIEDLFSLETERAEWILYIFRKGENGELFIRDPNGVFIKRDQKLFSLPVYARSVTKLPSFFPMGDTPTGIYRILGITTSSNPRIGPVPVIQLALPFEIPVNSFFPGIETVWSREIYSRFLPLSWKNNSQIYNTYQAGMIGRSNIWIHGATLDPKKFLNGGGKEDTFFTPTFGCISLPEKWEKGVLMESKQWDLVSLWLSEGGLISGYAILIDLPPESDLLEKALLKLKKPR